MRFHSICRYGHHRGCLGTVDDAWHPYVARNICTIRALSSDVFTFQLLTQQHIKSKWVRIEILAVYSIEYHLNSFRSVQIHCPIRYLLRDSIAIVAMSAEIVFAYNILSTGARKDKETWKLQCKFLEWGFITSMYLSTYTFSETILWIEHYKDNLRDNHNTQLECSKGFEDRVASSLIVEIFCLSGQHRWHRLKGRAGLVGYVLSLLCRAYVGLN